MKAPLKTVLKNFLDHVDDLEARKKLFDDQYESEFQELKKLTDKLKEEPAYSTSFGIKDVNRPKNRYKDIVPYDFSRVILPKHEGVPGSDYINASYIKGASGAFAYIAAQGPLPNTVIDFWRMIWVCDVQVIVMACNEREGGKFKCESYWPAPGETKQYGNICIELIDIDQVCPDFLVRTFLVTCDSEVRDVYQFHYTSWPDHGVPDTVQPILDLVRLMRDRQASETVPIVVHCSAGCGRTGTICAVDYVWACLRHGKLDEDFSLYQIALELRRQRIAMIQTKEQYVLAHKAVAAMFESQLKVIDCHIYENIDEDGEPLMWKEVGKDKELHFPAIIKKADAKENSEFALTSLTGFPVQRKANSNSFITLDKTEKIKESSIDNISHNSSIDNNLNMKVNPLECVNSSSKNSESSYSRNSILSQHSNEDSIPFIDDDDVCVRPNCGRAYLDIPSCDSISKLMNCFDPFVDKVSLGTDDSSPDGDPVEISNKMKDFQLISSKTLDKNARISQDTESKQIDSRSDIVDCSENAKKSSFFSYRESYPPCTNSEKLQKNFPSGVNKEVGDSSEDTKSAKKIGKATVVRRPSISKLKALFEKSSISSQKCPNDGSKRLLFRHNSHHVSRAGSAPPSLDCMDKSSAVERESILKIVTRKFRSSSVRTERELQSKQNEKTLNRRSATDTVKDGFNALTRTMSFSLNKTFKSYSPSKLKPESTTKNTASTPTDSIVGIYKPKSPDSQKSNSMWYDKSSLTRAVAVVKPTGKFESDSDAKSCPKSPSDQKSPNKNKSHETHFNYVTKPAKLKDFFSSLNKKDAKDATALWYNESNTDTPVDSEKFTDSNSKSDIANSSTKSANRVLPFLPISPWKRVGQKSPLSSPDSPKNFNVPPVPRSSKFYTSVLESDVATLNSTTEKNPDTEVPKCPVPEEIIPLNVNSMDSKFWPSNLLPSATFESIKPENKSDSNISGSKDIPKQPISTELTKLSMNTELIKQCTSAESTNQSASTEFEKQSESTERTKQSVNTDPKEQSRCIESTKQSVNAESTKQPMNAESTKQPINAESTKQPMNAESTKQPMNADSTKHSANAQPTKQLGWTESTKQSENTESTKLPISTESTKLPIGTESTKLPVSIELIKQPVTMESIKQPVSTKLIKQPVSTESIKLPMNTELIKHPVNSELTKQSVNTELTKQSVNTELTKQSMSTELTKQSMSTELTKQSTSTELTKQSTSTELTKQSASTELTKQSASTELTKQSASTELAKEPVNTELIKTNSTVKTNVIHDMPPAIPKKMVIGKNKNLQIAIADKNVEAQHVPVQQITASDTADKDNTEIKLSDKEVAKSPVTEKNDLYINVNIKAKKNIEQIENVIRKNPRSAIIDLTSRESYSMEEELVNAVNQLSESSEKSKEPSIPSSEPFTKNKIPVVKSNSKFPDYEVIWPEERYPIQKSKSTSKVPLTNKTKQTDNLNCSKIGFCYSPPLRRSLNASLSVAKSQSCGNLDWLERDESSLKEQSSTPTKRLVNEAVVELNTLLNQLTTRTLSEDVDFNSKSKEKLTVSEEVDKKADKMCNIEQNDTVVHSVTLVTKSYNSGSSPKEEEIVFHFPPPPRVPPPKDDSSTESFEIVCKGGSVMVKEANKINATSNTPVSPIKKEDTTKPKEATSENISKGASSQMFPQPAPRKSKQTSDLRRSSSYSNIGPPESKNKGYENVFLEKYQTLSKLEIKPDYGHNILDKVVPFQKSPIMPKLSSTKNSNYVNVGDVHFAGVSNLHSIKPAVLPVKPAVLSVKPTSIKNKEETHIFNVSKSQVSHGSPKMTVDENESSSSVYGKIYKISDRKSQASENFNETKNSNIIQDVSEVKKKPVHSKKAERAPLPPNVNQAQVINSEMVVKMSPNNSMIPKKLPSRKLEKAPPPPNLLQKSSSVMNVPKKNLQSPQSFVNFSATHRIEEKHKLPAVRENMPNVIDNTQRVSKKLNETVTTNKFVNRGLSHSQSDVSVYRALKERKIQSANQVHKILNMESMLMNKRKTNDLVTMSSSDSDSSYERIFLTKNDEPTNISSKPEAKEQNEQVIKSYRKEVPVAPPRSKRRSTTEVQYTKIKAKDASHISSTSLLLGEIDIKTSKSNSSASEDDPPAIPMKTRDAFEIPEESITTDMDKKPDDGRIATKSLK